MANLTRNDGPTKKHCQADCDIVDIEYIAPVSRDSKSKENSITRLVGCKAVEVGEAISILDARAKGQDEQLQFNKCVGPDGGLAEVTELVPKLSTTAHSQLLSLLSLSSSFVRGVVLRQDIR